MQTVKSLQYNADNRHCSWNELKLYCMCYTKSVSVLRLGRVNKTSAYITVECVSSISAVQTFKTFSKSIFLSQGCILDQVKPIGAVSVEFNARPDTI